MSLREFNRRLDRLEQRANAEQLELAKATLETGQTAIVNATFLDNEQRARFSDVAANQSVATLIVWTELDDVIARARLDRRAKKRKTTSDATVAIRKQQVAQLAATPLHIPDGVMAVTLDTGAAGPVSLDPFFTALDVAGLLGTLRYAGAPRNA